MTSTMIMNSAGLLEELLEYTSEQQLIDGLKIKKEQLNKWVNGEFIPTSKLERRLTLYCLKNKVESTFIRFGGRLPSYNIFADFDFESDPIGYEVKIPGKLYLKNQPTFGRVFILW